MKNVLISATLSATLGLSAFSSLAQDVDLRMSWWGGNGRHQVTLKALEEFHKQNPDINVKAEYTGWDGHLSRLTTQIAGGTEPDVMQTNWNWLPIFSKNGDGFYDLNTLKDEIDLSQFDAKELQSTTVNGKLNGIPISVTARVFYFNDEAWKKAGIPFPKTWDELMAAGKTFESKLGKQYYPVVLEHQDVLALLNSYMVQKYNQPAIDEKGRKFSYSKAQWADFFGMYKKLIDSHVMPDTRYYASFGKSNMYEMKPWIQGEWGGTYMWNSTINKYSDNLKPPAKLVLGEYPMLPGATDAGLFFKPAQMLSIGKSTKNPQAAAKVINFLLNSKEGVDILGLERGVPLSKAAVTYLTEDGVIKADDPAVSGLKLAQSLPTALPVSPYFDDPQIVAQFGTTLQYIDYGKKSVEEAAEDFQRQTDRILRRGRVCQTALSEEIFEAHPGAVAFIGIPALRCRGIEPRGIGAKVNIEVRHRHDIRQLPGGVQGMDVIAPRRQDSAIAIAFAGHPGHIELVDFIVRIDIAQLHAMPKGVDPGAEVGFVRRVQQGGTQINHRPILRIAFQGVPAHGQPVAGAV